MVDTIMQGETLIKKACSTLRPMGNGQEEEAKKKKSLFLVRANGEAVTENGEASNAEAEGNMGIERSAYGNKREK